MPWRTEQGGGDCGEDQWAVINEESGETEGCHMNEEAANAQMAALYASEEEMGKGGVMRFIVGETGPEIGQKVVEAIQTYESRRGSEWRNAPSKKTFALAEVKTIDSKDGAGEFEAILSAPTLDRDGEVIDAKAFEPLPEFIPVHAFHDFTDPIGMGQPFYDGDVLKIRGTFDPDERSQNIRQKVGKSIRFMSVGFMGADRKDEDGVPHIQRAELLEGSFVSIPSNRDAAVLMAKEYQAKVGARNSAKDQERIQATHDHMVELGAECAAKAAPPSQEKSTTPPEDAAAPAAAPPADVNVAKALIDVALVEAELLLAD